MTKLGSNYPKQYSSGQSVDSPEVLLGQAASTADHCEAAGRERHEWIQPYLDYHYAVQRILDLRRIPSCRVLQTAAVRSLGCRRFLHQQQILRCRDR
jgi:hypothetical protein